ncbi:MAG: TetR/AcrR family transcriptional regulator [Actinomycetes bacterium]
MTDPGDKPPRPTRDLIIDEAIACFAERGYDGTSLNDIAAGVGIRRPSLLHHFPSKETLYGSVFEQILSDWLERVGQAVEMDGTGWEKVELVLRAGFALFEDNPDYVRMMRREALDGGVRLGIDLASVLKPLFAAAAEYLDRMMDEGVLKRHDSRHLLITGYGAILTYFSDAPFITDLLDHQALTEANISEHREAVIELFRSALV